MPAPTHSRLPPSKAAGWSKCTASVPYIEANAAILPKDSSVYADRGTLVHAIATHYLGKGGMPEGLDKYPAKDQEEMKGCARDFAEFVLGRQQKGDRLYVDHRVTLFYLPSQRGTLDAAVRSQGKLYIDDYKDGVGVGVYAKENEQLSIYGESLLQELEEVEAIADDDLVVLSIYQPRDRNDPEPVRLWAVKRKELREFVKPIEAAAKLILDPSKRTQLKFVAGPHCDKGFCAARGICKHYATRGLEKVPETSLEQVGQSALPSPDSLTREQRVRIIGAKKALVSWLEAVEDQEVNELMAGAPRMGLKLVTGKTNRQWTSEEEADKLLGNHLTAEERRKPWEVVSPAQAEKLLKGKELSTKFENRFAELITRPEGKATLVSEDDKRVALEFNLTSGLHDVTAEESVL